MRRRDVLARWRRGAHQVACIPPVAIITMYGFGNRELVAVNIQVSSSRALDPWSTGG